MPEKNSQSVGIPPRSLLVSPPPMGLGSPVAESLSSYFCRVAAHNGMTPGQAVFGRCTRYLAEDHPDVATLRRIRRGGGPRRTLSVSPAGLEFAGAVARLVGRLNVRCLHWGRAMRCYSFARLVRGMDGFCPDCLRSDLDPYLRMIWEVELVTCCHIHGRRLLTACTSCGKVARRFRFDGQLSECPACGRDRRESLAPDATPHEIAAAEKWGELISEVTAPHSDLVTGDLAVTNVLNWAAARGASSVKKQARVLGLSTSTISLWRRSKFKPALTRIVELSITKRLPIAPLFKGQLTGGPLATQRAEPSQAWSARKLELAERQAIVERLEALANRAPPVSLSRIARMLNVSLATLQTIAPGLCLGIIASAASDQRRIKEAKLAWYCRKVDGYVSASLAAGQCPTWRGLESEFEKPGVLRNRLRRDYAKAAIRNGREWRRHMPLQLELRLND